MYTLLPVYFSYLLSALVEEWLAFVSVESSTREIRLLLCRREHLDLCLYCPLCDLRVERTHARRPLELSNESDQTVKKKRGLKMHPQKRFLNSFRWILYFYSVVQMEERQGYWVLLVSSGVFWW